jgi:hypothetical protein
MVPAMAERLASGRRQRIHELVRRETLRREPSRRIGEGSSTATDYNGNQHQRSKHGPRGRLARLGHSSLTVTLKFTIPLVFVKFC